MSTPRPTLNRDHDPLAAIISEKPPSYALIRRREAHGGSDLMDVLVGESLLLESLSELASVSFREGGPFPEHGTLALLPFRQIAERGYDHVDDGEKLRVLRITESTLLPSTDVISRLPRLPISLRGEQYDIDDHQYAELARRIIETEIGGGSGANFVLKRTFISTIKDFNNLTALSLFRSLLTLETGTYWTFIVYTGDRFFVGATPERHISLSQGVATMNPISGTYRYPSAGPSLDGVRSFLADSKEVNELYMVVDEELKMMARICDNGGTVYGPTIKPMARLAHTEYHITGQCKFKPDHVLRETMFAPTITGSPLENACRVIKKYEPEGRAYYSGILALIGHDDEGNDRLDSAIVIRTADISGKGDLRIGVGSTLVRDSDPISEAGETKAKASGLLLALKGSGASESGSAASATNRIVAQFSEFEQDASIRRALTDRNSEISPFWLAGDRHRIRPQSDLAGLSTLIVDAEDTFTSMIKHQLRALGLSVVVRRHDDPIDFDQFQLVVMGPGPGDPRDIDNPRVRALERITGKLLLERRPFLAVCLSHQVLCLKLGLDIQRRPCPNQGTRRQIDLFGKQELVGFYNSYNAVCERDFLTSPNGQYVSVGRDPISQEVFALKSQLFASFQFHAESVLTKNGDLIFRSYVRDLTRASYSGNPEFIQEHHSLGWKGQTSYDEHHR